MEHLKIFELILDYLPNALDDHDSKEYSVLVAVTNTWGHESAKHFEKELRNRIVKHIFGDLCFAISEDYRERKHTEKGYPDVEPWIANKKRAYAEMYSDCPAALEAVAMITKDNFHQ